MPPDPAAKLALEKEFSCNVKVAANAGIEKTANAGTASNREKRVEGSIFKVVRNSSDDANLSALFLCCYI
jgi:hypothetical protein